MNAPRPLTQRGTSDTPVRRGGSGGALGGGSVQAPCLSHGHRAPAGLFDDQNKEPELDNDRMTTAR